MTRTLVLLAALTAGSLYGLGPDAAARHDRDPGVAPRQAIAQIVPAPQNQSPARPDVPEVPDPVSSEPASQEPDVPVVDPDQAAPTIDPAAVGFTSDAGLLLAAVTPTATADYEEAMAALHRALHASDDPAVRAMAEGWTVYKAAEPDAKGNTIYVHFIRAPVEGADYRPSLLLDAVLAQAPEDLLVRYRAAFAGPPSKLSLNVLADLAGPPPPPGNATPDGPTTPAVPGNATPPAPGNVTPAAPANVTPARPGNVTPAAPGNVTPARPGNVTPARPGNRTPAVPGKSTPTSRTNRSPGAPRPHADSESRRDRE